MPTGYTAEISKGISFKQFILSCARAFGACATMRDESSDTPIPEEFKPTEYHTKEILKARDRIKHLQTMSDLEAERRAKKEYKQSIANKTTGIEKANVLRAKYNQMLQQVEAWQPPSPDHMELKEFMIQQINSSIKFDCGIDYYLEMKISLLSAKEWREKELKEAFRSLAYHQKEDLKERARVSSRNRWIKQLRKSIEEL